MKERNLTTPILIVLLLIAVGLVGSFYTKIQYLEGDGRNQAKPTPTPTHSQPTKLPYETTIGNFLITRDEICQEKEKPIIYFFGGSFCPHCKWEQPVVERVVKKFGQEIVFRNNMDNQTADQEIFAKYSDIHQGSVPFLIFGCRYVRVGSGERQGEKTEEKNLTALICRLTNNQPQEVCAPIKDLVEQIKD